MIAVCSWCNDLIRVKPAPDDMYHPFAVTHGMCSTCLQNQLALLETNDAGINQKPHVPKPTSQEEREDREWVTNTAGSHSTGADDRLPK